MKRAFSNWWVLTGAAAVLAAAFLAFGLPLVAPSLRPALVRLLFVLVVALAWGLFAFLRVLKGRKANDAIADEIIRPRPGEAESAALAERMREALAKLKTASGGRRDYLYARPWYVIIGPPGAGKTTALLNSGLRFPFSDAALKGVGGTRNLDFWFADEAVLVDTAGRYTTQDSDRDADAGAWTGFLALLRRVRPLQPVNGVLVAIGLDELLTADRAGLDAHASAVRRRLLEVRQALEVSAPVYLLLTKADLLAGFTEFYEDLDVEGRRAVLGATFPFGEVDAARVLAEFDGVTQALADRLSKRLQDEGDPRRRSLILGFPAQVAGLRARLARFVEGAFLAETGPARPVLRGVYLASGLQQGAPLDRLLAGVSSAYSAPQPPGAGGGRAYFLNRLLNEVIFPEAGLVSGDRKAVGRRRGQLVAGLAGVAVASLLVLLAWGVSFGQNRALQSNLLAGAQNADAEVRNTGVDLAEVRDSDPDLEQSLSVLRALRGLPRGYGDQRKGGPPLAMRFGLYQSGHASEASRAYLNAAERVLLPRILLRLEHVLRADAAQPLSLYEPLKVYLMLGGQGPLDRRAVKAWVEADWAQNVYPGEDRKAVRDELAQHLDAVLADRQFGQVWPEGQAPLDGALVASSRAAVQTLSLADRAYAILRQRAASSGGPDWRADAVLSSGDGRAFANGDAVLAMSVPYFYTRAGYDKAYRLGLDTVQGDLEKDLWVLGSDQDRTAVRAQMSGVRQGVASLYARDYIAAWDTVVKTPQPGDYFHDATALAVFTRQPSPLKLLLQEVRKNTTFGGGAAAGAAGSAALTRGVQSLAYRAPGGQYLGAAATQGNVQALAGAAGGHGDASQQIEAYFRPLDDYAGAPVDDFVAAVKQAGAATTAAGIAGGGLGGSATQGQLATAVAGVATSAGGAPAQLQGFVAAAAKGGDRAAVSSAHGAIADQYAKSLQPACAELVNDHYPFFGASQTDAPVAEMIQLFGVNGQFDSFVRASAASLLDMSGPVWRWKAGDPVAATLDPTSAEAFQKAAGLRDLLSSGLPLKVELVGLGGSVTAAEVSSGGTTYRFEANTVGSKPLMWSITGGLPEAHVTLFSGAKGDAEVKRFDASGPWALYRLMDSAKKENDGPTAIKATFGQGAQFVTLKFTLPSDKNPFSRGGLWSFRCPARL
jgi:type VI secretion system protein ImpL